MMALTCDNESGPRGAGNTTGGLTRTTSTQPKEGLAMQATRSCSLPDCDLKHHARGFCRSHYHQHVTPAPGKPRLPLRERFMASVQVDADQSGCWLWTRRLHPTGYGYFSTRRPDGKWGPRRAHRVSYELFVGPIPDGLTIDHLCGVRHCVNPQHLNAVTQRENTLRNGSPAAENARVETCLRGHPLEGDNLQVINSAAGVKRRCKTCARERRRVRRLGEAGAA